MKMNLKTLGLGAVLTFTLITPAFADQNVNIIKKVDFQKPKIEKKVLSVEEQTKKLEQTLQNIEKAYKDGKMTEETYTAKKENIKKIMEDVKNGKEIKKIKKMNTEEMIKKCEESLQKLEAAYKKGKINEEIYTAKKENLTKWIDNIKNGKKAYVSKTMTIEEKIQKQKSFLEKIEKSYEKGELSEEQYKQYKTKVEKGLEKLTNQ